MSRFSRYQDELRTDVRAAAALPLASAEVTETWTRVAALTAVDLPGMGLAAGDRPASDIEVLAAGVAALEYELARRMHAAAASGSLPLAGPGAMLTARGWSATAARRLARAGGFAADHPTIASAWAAGIITSEHVDAVVRHCDPLTAEELSAVLDEMSALWGQWTPAAVARFVQAAVAILHPPRDDQPDPGESAAHAARGLSFSLLGDTVLLCGQMPRLDGELVLNAIEAFAERLRTSADHIPAAARRADALVELVNAAHANGALPTRAGLPVALTVTVDRSAWGDTLWTTSRGHALTPSEQRFAVCDAAVTPVTVAGQPCPDRPPGRGTQAQDERLSALAVLLTGPRRPIDVGRTARTATLAQRRALAVRDRGCVVPGCQVPPDACQTHHLQEWAAGGSSDLPNMVLLCWTHHRQVDLQMWTIHPNPPRPGSGLPGGAASTPWPANNHAPWTIAPAPRRRWRT